MCMKVFIYHNVYSWIQISDAADFAAIAIMLQLWGLPSHGITSAIAVEDCNLKPCNVDSHHSVHVILFLVFVKDLMHGTRTVILSYLLIKMLVTHFLTHFLTTSHIWIKFMWVPLDMWVPFPPHLASLILKLVRLTWI